MHEMAIAMALIDQVEQAAREQKAQAIASITVAVGRLSGVDPDALRAVFELAAEETLAAGAQLVAPDGHHWKTSALFEHADDRHVV